MLDTYFWINILSLWYYREQLVIRNRSNSSWLKQRKTVVQADGPLSGNMHRNSGKPPEVLDLPGNRPFTLFVSLGFLSLYSHFTTGNSAFTHSSNWAAPIPSSHGSLFKIIQQWLIKAISVPGLEWNTLTYGLVLVSWSFQMVLRKL